MRIGLRLAYVFLSFTTTLFASSPVGYSTFFGGNGEEDISAIKVDSAGNVIVAGATSSSNFPTTPGAYMPTSNAGQDCGGTPCMVAFVSKLDPTGSKIIFSTFFPAGIYALATDPAGNIYLTGNADAGLPATSGALNSGHDLHVSKLNASGTTLEYAARFGSSAHDWPTGIAADANGNAYVVGWSYGTDFPVTSGAFQTAQTGAFVTKVNASGTALVYSARLGGSDSANAGANGTRPEAIAVSPAGEAYVTGLSDSPTFPTTPNAFQPKRAGFSDAVLFRLSADGSTLIYSTFLGGTGAASFPEGASAIAIDGQGGAYITGGVGGATFPVSANAFQKWFPYRGSNSFVARFNTNAGGAASLIYSTLLGGRTDTYHRGISIDSGGNAYLVGLSSDVAFPTTPTAIQACSSTGTPFVTVLGPKGDHLLFSTFIGGSLPPPSPMNLSKAIGLDGSNNVYIAGNTSTTNFPTTADSFQPANGGGLQDGFITKFNRNSFTAPSPRVVICKPLNGATVNGTFPVAGSLQSGYRAKFVEIDVDGVSVFHETQWNVVSHSITVAPGQHQLTIRGETASSVMVSKTITITVK